MAKRRFELPGIKDLSKEQEKVRALPKEGQHLVVGGPGTGKSVLALIRVRRHHREEDDYIFLVYNHLLNRSSEQLFGEGSLNSETWIKWFHKEFKKITNKPTPKLPPDRPDGYQEIDWKEVEKIIEEQPLRNHGEQSKTFLVIDEGQDMPPEFYTLLIRLGFENLFVVADQNQQIRKQNSSRQEIQDRLGIETSDVIELKDNYRNQIGVAKLAGEFYTADPASPPPRLPTRGLDTPSQLLYYPRKKLSHLVKIILQLADRNPEKLIGLITPNNEVRERYLTSLNLLNKSSSLHLDNGPVPISTYYHTADPSEVSFDKGGIIVINAQSCKGLEFDIVMLADIDKHRYSPDNHNSTKRLFYVMVARAIERVFMFMQQENKSKPINGILPEAQDILRRMMRRKSEN